MKNIITIANYIRKNASNLYKERVGKFNEDSKIDELANPLMRYEVTMNEFATGLMNVIGETIINRIAHFDNPLAKFKKVTKGLGIDTREIARGIAKAEKFDFSNEGIAKMFKIYPPEIAECFHRLNRREFYPITMSKKELALALQSWDDLQTFIDDVVIPLYEANYLDEYKYSIELIRASLNADNIKRVDITDSDSLYADYIITVKDMVKSFRFADITNSVYGNTKKDAGEETNIIPLCSPEDASLIIPYPLKNRIKVKELMAAFNKDEASFDANVTEVDQIGYIMDNTDPDNIVYYEVLGVVCDKNWLRILDDPDNEVLSNQLPTARAFNSYLHVWQTYSTSPFKCVNAIVRQVEESDIPDGYFDNLMERETDIETPTEGN